MMWLIMVSVAMKMKRWANRRNRLLISDINAEQQILIITMKRHSVATIQKHRDSFVSETITSHLSEMSFVVNPCHTEASQDGVRRINGHR